MKQTIEKCDRCGKEIEFKLFPITRAKISRTVFFGFGSYNYSNQNGVLCDKCTKDFDEFMENTK